MTVAVQQLKMYSNINQETEETLLSLF